MMSLMTVYWNRICLAMAMIATIVIIYLAWQGRNEFGRIAMEAETMEHGELIPVKEQKITSVIEIKLQPEPIQAEQPKEFTTFIVSAKVITNEPIGITCIKEHMRRVCTLIQAADKVKTADVLLLDGIYNGNPIRLYDKQETDNTPVKPVEKSHVEH